MNQQHYCTSFTVQKTAREAFDCINRVSDWWTVNLEGESSALNDVFTAPFGKTSATMRLTEVVPDRKIVWHVVDCYLDFLRDKTEWKNTRIVWDISWGNEGTTVHMMHEGLAPELECYDNCVKGWDFYVKSSLYKLLTEGKGTPDAGNEARREKGAAQRRAPRAVADVEKGTILATADVAMPPERVFCALTDAREIEQWWGASDVYRMKDWVADTRVGGRYSVIVHRPDGNDLPASGKFLEIEQPRKLVHTRKYEWDHPTLGQRETTISYHLDPVGAGTRVTVRHEGFAGCDEAAYEHAEGWERVLGWLDHYLYYEFYFPKN